MYHTRTIVPPPRTINSLHPVWTTHSIVWSTPYGQHTPLHSQLLPPPYNQHPPPYGQYSPPYDQPTIQPTQPRTPYIVEPPSYGPTLCTLLPSISWFSGVEIILASERWFHNMLDNMISLTRFGTRMNTQDMQVEIQMQQ